MKKVLLSVGSELLSAVDEYCKKYNYERSEFFRSILRERVYFASDVKNQKAIIPNLINKAVEVEKQVEQVKNKTSKIISSPLSTKRVSMYSFCPKHSTFFASCGCTPK